MSKFFIERPVFATVLALLITLAGIIAIFSLPLEQYPNLTPPTVSVSADYPGADPEVLSTTVAAPLEEQINGVENMLYMNSVSDSYGNMGLVVYFNVGADPDMATVNVNNLVQEAARTLPAEVQQYGVTVRKRSPEILQILSLTSPDNMYDTTYIANYALVNVVDALKRVEGVGDAQVMGANNYSMRIWLRPDAMASYKISPADVAAAVGAQNKQRAVGISGAPPVSGEVKKSFTLKAPGRLETEEEFKNIILRSNPDGSALFLKDIADVELGAQTYSFYSATNKIPSVPIAIFLDPGSNAVTTANGVNAAMAEMSKTFPQGIKYDIAYDTTTFITESIREVVFSLIIAMVLVFAVVYLFLQNFRATLIPCIAVPVSIIGAFAGMYALGFSINTLTLFGLVLAIGMVVDDAIVVIENVSRIMETEHLSPKEASIKAMDEVQGALIAIVCVLCSVFIPVSFMGGFTGVLYRQFAITIAVSVVISGFVALTLTPALCALLLKADAKKPKGLFQKFNGAFSGLTEKYGAGAAYFVRRLSAAVICMVLIFVLCAVMYKVIPGGFIPSEDQGAIMVSANLDPASSLDASSAVADTLEDIIMASPAVDFAMAFTGRDMLNNAQRSNAVSAYVRLKPWNKRKGAAHSADAMVAYIQKEAAQKIPGAVVMAFNPPAIMGLSTTGGLESYIQNRGSGTSADLEAQTRAFIEAASKDPAIAMVNTTFSNSVAQYNIKVDNERALAAGVSLDDLYMTMQAMFGSYYINDFTKYERSFKVMMQAREDFRRYPEQLGAVFVKNSSGGMVPVGELITLTPILGTDAVERYNVFPSAKIIAAPAAGVSSASAMTTLENIALKTLGPDFALAWTGTAYQEQSARGDSFKVLALGILVVFFILCALYEKWSLPFAVLLAVPFAVFGALIGTWARGLDSGIYFQIALVALVGLSAKNAILIVEFAEQQRKAGKPLLDAVMQAARLRFRPIIMTSLAFILGSLPLAISTGAGANSRHALGTAVVAGMLGATLIAPILVPLFFFLISGGYKKVKGENQ